MEGGEVPSLVAMFASVEVLIDIEDWFRGSKAVVVLPCSNVVFRATLSGDASSCLPGGMTIASEIFPWGSNGESPGFNSGNFIGL